MLYIGEIPKDYLYNKQVNCSVRYSNTPNYLWSCAMNGIAYGNEKEEFKKQLIVTNMNAILDTSSQFIMFPKKYLYKVKEMLDNNLHCQVDVYDGVEDLYCRDLTYFKQIAFVFDSFALTFTEEDLFEKMTYGSKQGYYRLLFKFTLDDSFEGVLLGLLFFKKYFTIFEDIQGKAIITFTNYPNVSSTIENMTEPYIPEPEPTLEPTVTVLPFFLEDSSQWQLP